MTITDPDATATEPDPATEADETTPEAAEPPEAPEQSDDGTEPAEDDDAAPQSNREAKYRRQLREVEAARDQLAERLTTMQRSEAERHAADVLANPAALWLDGTDLATLIDEDGHVDPDKVRGVADGLATNYGLERARKSGNYVPRESHSTRPPSRKPTLEDAFRPTD